MRVSNLVVILKKVDGNKVEFVKTASGDFRWKGHDADFYKDDSFKCVKELYMRQRIARDSVWFEVSTSSKGFGDALTDSAQNADEKKEFENDRLDEPEEIKNVGKLTECL